MAVRIPPFLKLRRDALERRDAVASLVAHALRPSSATLPRVVHSFAFKNDEHAFARALLRAKSQLWLYRANQRSFSGDFIVVDVSSPDLSRRRAVVLDLKRGAPVRIGGGGAGVQFRNAAWVVREMARATGALDELAPVELVSGDGALLLAHFGVAPPS